MKRDILIISQETENEEKNVYFELLEKKGEKRKRKADLTNDSVIGDNSLRTSKWDEQMGEKRKKWKKNEGKKKEKKKMPKIN